MPIMKRSCPEIQGSSHDKDEETGDAMENCSQTHDRHKQFMHQQSPPSQPSHPLSRLKKMFSRQGIKQTPCNSDDDDIHFRRLRMIFSRQKTRETPSKSDGGDFPYLTSMFSSGNSSSILRIPQEGYDASHPDGTIEHDPKMDQIQDHVPWNDDQPAVVDLDNSGQGNINNRDPDHPTLRKHMNVNNSSKWCSICRDVGEWMVRGKAPRIDIGTWEDLQARAGCPSCDDMLSMPSSSRPIDLHEKLYFRPGGTYGGYSYEFNFGVGNVFLNPSDRALEKGLMGAVVDPNWFSIAKLQTWLGFCDEHHGEECHGLPITHDSVSTRPRFLIDVVRGCLVESHGDERYFALSYVWGSQQEAGMATTENIESLKQAGAITVRNQTFRLPRTVEDAIQLTELLGERFLWVDRLCIIQDDLENWHSQIKRMGSIYANAYCTFVASQGEDADHGIAGLNQRSGPRNLVRRRIRFPSLQMVEVGVSAPTSTSTWITRGWTFQELKLSRRAIFFNDDIRWTCYQSRWQEEIPVELDGIPSQITSQRKNPLSILSVEPWPDFMQWVVLIGQYCTRKFSFEEDAGAAFAGVEEILSHSFPGGFCFGMPEFYFDIALLWWPRTPRRRRTPKHDGSSDLPSWSFLGWKGGYTDMYGPAFAYEWLTGSPNIRCLCRTSFIRPKVDWIQTGPHGQQRRIRNDYHVWKTSQDRISPEAHAELGWRRDGNKDDWTHASIPNAVFRYPVPVGFQTVTDEYHTWSPSLRLRSQSTFLRISNIIDWWRNPGTCIATELVTDTGKWAGMLHLNESKAKNVPFGERCELVALSCGSVSNEDGHAHIWMEEWKLDSRPNASEKYEFYNVMWIRREGTYVLRENVGRVEKSVWDSQELQEIDVELR